MDVLANPGRDCWEKLARRKVRPWGIAHVAGARGLLQALLYVGTLLALGTIPTHADPSEDCDDAALEQVYSDMMYLSGQQYDALSPCGTQQYQNCRPPPDAARIVDGRGRLKHCADASSATGASLYGAWVVYDDLSRLRASMHPPERETYAHVRARLDYAFSRELRDANEELPGAAAEALGYLQRAYALDSSEAFAAEDAADLLASGDVGPDRSHEALDWYHKACTGYASLVALGMSKDFARQQVTRILDKMTQIDRENPLTRKVEQLLYK
jgi:hypothetical protein